MENTETVRDIKYRVYRYDMFLKGIRVNMEIWNMEIWKYGTWKYGTWKYGTWKYTDTIYFLTFLKGIRVNK